MAADPARYDLEEHRHRFAVWAAARAAQRGFASVTALRVALEECGIREHLRDADLNDFDDDRFNALHREWCTKIVHALGKTGLSNVTFGRAAKLIAVYLKSVVVLGPNSGTAFARVAHPPIDSILLKGMACDPNLKDNPYARAWAKIRWTALDQDRYYELIEQLRDVIGFGKPFWMLERYWNVTSDADSE